MGCEIWTIKKAECQRIELLNCGIYWRRLLRVPWTERKSNKSILKEISPEYSLEGLMLKLIQYFDHLMGTADSLEKMLIPGKDWRQKEKGKTENEMVGWHHRLDGHEFEHALEVVWTGKPGVLQSMGSQRVRLNWLNWTECIHLFQYVRKKKWNSTLI